MKKTIKVCTEKEVEITSVAITIQLHEDDCNHPLVKDGEFHAVINIDTGVIKDWPQGRAETIHAKVCDGGYYELLGPMGMVANLEYAYVPHGAIPGEFGDYVILKIDETGKITNWPKNPNVDEFFQED